MQDKHLFEYAVIRVVPKVEREEFLNVGVVLYCRKLKYLRFEYVLEVSRLGAFSRSIDLEELKEHLHSFQKIAEGVPTAGPIAALDVASRFRWLTATRSTIVQSSKVHPGFCADPQEAIERLHKQLVTV